MAPPAGVPVGEGVADEAFLDCLDEITSIIEGAGITYVLMGGIGSATLGRPRWTHDIDLFVRPEDAGCVLDLLAQSGYETEKTFPHWLYKGYKDGVLVDVIFKSKGDIYLDEEMVRRAHLGNFQGRRVRVIPPEDLLIIKAAVHDEHMPRHWHDALGIISSCEMDWEYVMRRARQHGARRVLSLLVYAQSNDLLVPDWIIRRLAEAIYGPEPREAP